MEKKVLFRVLRRCEDECCRKAPSADLRRRFEELERHVLRPVRLDNAWRIVSANLSVRNRSIELLDIVLEGIDVGSDGGLFFGGESKTDGVDLKTELTLSV